MKQRGFTLIEFMIVLAIVGILASVALGVGGSLSGNNTISWGLNGMMETRCVEGYKFVIDQDGRTRQILDEFGKGVRCEQASVPGGPR